MRRAAIGMLYAWQDSAGCRAVTSRRHRSAGGAARMKRGGAAVCMCGRERGGLPTRRCRLWSGGAAGGASVGSEWHS